MSGRIESPPIGAAGSRGNSIGDAQQIVSPSTTSPHNNQSRRIATCVQCGQRFPRDKCSGRKPKYCSYKCRDAARRDRNFVGSGSTRRAPTKNGQAIPRNASKTDVVSIACKGDFRARGIDLRGLDAELRRLILAAELPRLRPDHQHKITKRWRMRHD